MQDEANGVPVKTVKSFMSKIPSVFTGKAFFQIFFIHSFMLFSHSYKFIPHYAKYFWKTEILVCLLLLNSNTVSDVICYFL